MSGLLTPPPLFNPLTDGALTPAETFAGPFGLLAYLPLVPVVVWLARWRRSEVLIGSALVWLLVTLNWKTTAGFLGALTLASAYVLAIGALRRRQMVSERVAIASVWVGLHLLALIVWWPVHELWYGSRMAAFHPLGLAYFLLRFIAWGVDLAKRPNQALRPVETACWLLYPACMRLGPLMMREDFLKRYDEWDPRRSPAWIAGLRRFGLFILGGAVLGFVGNQIPHTTPGGTDFFSNPDAYLTGQLVQVFYLVPIQIYLILWTYNELASAIGWWIGIPVDNNFRWLPAATSVRDFWRRWHITLGQWLRNYMYIPLGGNRRHVELNYLAVFGYCGLWHGPSWSFVAWGVSQAVALTIQRHYDRLRQRWRWLGRLRGPIYVAACWLLTVHYQLATVVVFVDFEHCGTRLLAELVERLAG